MPGDVESVDNLIRGGERLEGLSPRHASLRPRGRDAAVGARVFPRGGGDPVVVAVVFRAALLQKGFQTLLFFFIHEEGFVRSFPHANRAIVTAGDGELAARRQRDAPRRRVVALQREQRLELIGVPVLDEAVLSGAEKVVGLWHKRNRRDAVLVGKHRPVTVAEIETPDPNVLVRTARRQKLRVRRHVVAERG